MDSSEHILPNRLIINVSLQSLEKRCIHKSEFILIWPSNLVYIGIFFFVELSFGLVAASYFAAADGHAVASIGLKKAGGVFAFLAGLLGYYTVGNLMCQQALFFSFPMGDTSSYFVKKEKKEV